MKVNLIRLMLVANGGWGNPNQYRLITPDTPDNNYDLFAVNVNNENTNFVLFARPKREWERRDGSARMEWQRRGANVGIACGDALNIFDYIYEIACKTYDASDRKASEKFIFLIDISGVPQLEHAFVNDKTVSVDGIGIHAITPAAHRFANIMRDHARHHGCELDFEFSLCNYGAEDCQKFFFPNCDRLEDGKCSKCNKSQNK